nr:hypothetical protein [uncultured Draconibacterium sp.]
MASTKDKILIENDRRNGLLDAYYNPYSGEGSLINRQMVQFAELPDSLYLPIEMLNVPWVNKMATYNSISDAAKANTLDTDVLFTKFIEERFKHDFEFWAAQNVKIKPKAGGDYIPFILNYPQRKMHNVTYSQIVANEPIRQILLKSRQFGGSTYIQIFEGYIQIEHKTNWNSLVAAHLNQAATNIRFMFSTLQKYYPTNISSAFTLKSFESTKNIKFIPERNCKITVGSIETPDSIRADDVAMAHLSEVGLWKKTDGKSPADLCQSILGTIPTVPWSMYVLESTAKGTGNFFHKSWQNATSGVNSLTPVFVPWLEDPKNRIPFKTIEEKIKLASTLSEYEEFLWQCGATLEGINFYRFKLAEMEGDEWRMKSEFPTTADEAFQATGQKVFAPSYTKAVEEDCREPEFKGEVFADARSGKNALNNIRFDRTKNGNLWIWQMPDLSEKIDYRYCAFADIGGRTKDADFSVLKIIDRYWMMEGGDPEVVAVWYGHLDQDLFAWKCAQICSMYDNALLAIEVNSLEKEETEGNHFLTVLNEIAPNYSNLYTRNDFEKVDDSYVPKYGFHTNVKTKGDIINALNAACRERFMSQSDNQEGHAYIERDQRAVDEMNWFVTKPNGKQEAVEGAHDDMVMTTAGCVWLATKFMPLPKIRQESNQNRKRKMKSEASF